MSEENQSMEKNTESTESSVVQRTEKKNGAKWFIVILLVLAVALAALAYFDVINLYPNGSEGEVSIDGVDPGTIVATVNGAEITRGNLNEKMDQVRRSLPAGVPDPTQDASFELQLLEDLINLELLTAEAKSKNFTVSEDEIEAEKTKLIEQFGGEETFQQQLELLGITEEELDSNMHNELLIRQLLEEETTINSIEVTQEEIEAAYTQAVGTTEDAPPLEQVEELIRSELLNQKTAAVVETYLDELRADAEITRSL